MLKVKNVSIHAAQVIGTVALLAFILFIWYQAINIANYVDLFLKCKGY